MRPQVKNISRLCTALSLLGPLLAGPPSVGAACTVGGSSTLSAPQATHLRSYRAGFATPSRLAADASGNVYVADPGRGEIVVRAADGRVARRAGGLGRPISVAVAPDRVYVGDADSGAVRVLDADWQPLYTLAGGALNQPSDLAVDAASGRLYVADSPAHRVHVYDAGGAYVHSFGEEGSGDGQFRFPGGVFVDSAAGEVLVADQLNYRIQIFDLDGSFLSCFGAQGSTPGRFNMPQSVLSDGAGRIYVADALEGRVQVLDHNGAPLATIGDFGETRGQLRIPVGIAVDGANRLYVGAVNNARLEVYGLAPYSDPESVVPARVDFHPARIDRAVTPPLLTASLEVPGYPLAQIDGDSIRANGVAPAGAPRYGDADGNGVPEARVDFDAAALLGTLPATGSGTVNVTGELGSAVFAADTALAVTLCDAATHCPLDGADPQCNEAVCLADVGCAVRAKDDGAGCEDGDACTIDDVCTAGVCGGATLGCDDRNPCTDDRCDSATGCENTANAAPCDDGSACTEADRCADALCAGVPIGCDDGNPCTDDSCDPATGCEADLNSAPCDDGDACTVDDVCSAGRCSGAARHCDDGNPCSDDYCDPSLGCRSIANGAPCDDSDACTVLDACSARTCSGAPLDCDDGNPCTDDSCEAVGGCTHAATLSPCDDADPGTAGDTCRAGGDCRGRVTAGDYAILALPADTGRSQRLSIGRQAWVGGSACADTMFVASGAEIAGDLVAAASGGHAVTFQRGGRVAGDLVTGGASVGQLRRADVGGRIDLDGSGAELAECAAARSRVAQRRDALHSPSVAGDLALGSVDVAPGATRRVPPQGTFGPAIVVVDTGELRLGPTSTLLLAASAATERVVVRVGGRMTVGPGAQVALENLQPEQILFLVDGPVLLNRGAGVAGTVLARGRVRLGLRSAVAGALLGSNLDLAPQARVELHPFAGW